MGALKKILIGTGIATGLTAIYLYGRRIKKATDNLVVIPSFRLHKIDLKSIVMVINLDIKNPSNKKLLIASPFVRINFKGNTIGSSQPQNEEIELLPNGGPKEPIKPIIIETPLLGAFSLAMEFLKSIQSKDAIEIEIITTTSLLLGPVRLPYTDTRKVTLKKQG